MPKSLCFIPFAVVLFVSSAVHAQDLIEEVKVFAEFRPRAVFDTATSLSIIDTQQLRARKAVHLEDVLNLVPNVNFSSGASRGRFFQIRGIGERSQFVEPINPSVGLLIDGIDFTGLGGAATTLDVKQVEVLRGPQGTLFGANALAGLINIVSNDPSDAGGELSLTLADYDTQELTQVISGSVAENVDMRFAMAKNQSDGYIRNTFLNRDDTNNIDETTLRGKVHWQAGDNTLIKLVSYFVDTDNGYDAFSLDNTRETLSDQPGTDAITTRAFSLQLDQDFSAVTWQSVASFADADSEYGFDEDWSFRTICAIDSDCAFFQYSSTDAYLRDQRNAYLDTRVLSNSDLDALSWVAGMYYRDQSEELKRIRVDNDPNFDSFYGPITDPEITRFTSEFDTENIALYGQLDIPFAALWNFSLGGRVEQRDADYRDSDANQLATDEDLWGMRVALEYRPQADRLAYGLISRGYKAGGVNALSAGDSPLIPLSFDTEFMWNYELGMKAQWWDGHLSSQMSVFYQDREDIQVRQSLVTSRATGEVNGDCPCDFTDFIGNAAAGSNYGAEVELMLYPGDRIKTWLNLGWLETEYRDFLSFSHVAATPEVPVDLDGRAQAHAPNYQFAAGVEIGLSEHLVWQLDVEGKDEFFLSSRHNESTDAYALWNMRLSYQHEDWQIALWGKNLTDEDIIVRGFGSFGNDPRKFYDLEPYYQYGAPRVVGISASLFFR